MSLLVELFDPRIAFEVGDTERRARHLFAPPNCD
jgi:hypothetical protein